MYHFKKVFQLHTQTFLAINARAYEVAILVATCIIQVRHEHNGTNGVEVVDLASELASKLVECCATCLGCRYFG